MSTLDADDREYLEALLEPIKQSVQRHEKALYGNGQLGLMERMTQRDGTLGLHASQISDVVQAKHTHGTKDRLTLSGVSAFVSAIVAGVIAGMGTHK